MLSLRAIVLFILPLLLHSAAGSSVYDHPSPIVANKPNVLRYRVADITQPCSIVVLRGPNGGNGSYVTTITTTATGGEYTWIPNGAFENADDYWFVVAQGVDEDVTMGSFSLTGGVHAKSSATATAVAATISSSLDKHSNGSERSGASLSRTALIGIGVGAAVVILTLIGVIAAFWFRLRKLRAEKSAVGTTTLANRIDSAAFASINQHGHRTWLEKDGETSLRELDVDAQRYMYEAGGRERSWRYELGS